MSKVAYLTIEGLQKLKEELNNLMNIERPRISAQIADARDKGDLGENAEYEAAKGGGHWMDFSRIAEEYLKVKLSTVAVFFLFLCLITPLLTYFFFRYKNKLFHFFSRVLTTEPNK